MKTFTQQQQEQQQQQWQQQRQQQMGADWMQKEQQKAKQRKMPRAAPRPHQPVVVKRRTTEVSLPKKNRLGASVFLLTGIVLTAFTGYLAAFIVNSNRLDDASILIAAGAVWLIGLVITVLVTRRIWRGY